MGYIYKKKPSSSTAHTQPLNKYNTALSQWDNRYKLKNKAAGLRLVLQNNTDTSKILYPRDGMCGHMARNSNRNQLRYSLPRTSVQ